MYLYCNPPRPITRIQLLIIPDAYIIITMKSTPQKSTGYTSWQSEPCEPSAFACPGDASPPPLKKHGAIAKHLAWQPAGTGSYPFKRPENVLALGTDGYQFQENKLLLLHQPQPARSFLWSIAKGLVPNHIPLPQIWKLLHCSSCPCCPVSK